MKEDCSFTQFEIFSSFVIVSFVTKCGWLNFDVVVNIETSIL